MTPPIDPDAADASTGTPVPIKDDPLLRELAARARDRAASEREQLDERWDRLAAGALTPEEEAELRAHAEGTAEGAAALAAFQPLGPAAEARIVARIRAQRKAERSTGPAAPVVAAQPALRSSNVLPFRPRIAAWSGGIGLAAAAVLVAVLVLPGRSGPLPYYTAEIKGGDKAERNPDSEAETTKTFSRGARFELVLRPAQEVTEDVAVRCLLVASGGGPPRPFPACDDAKLSGGGSLRVVGTVGSEIEFLRGDWTLWAIVARRGKLPDDPPVSGVAKRISGKGWIGIPTPIRFTTA